MARRIPKTDLIFCQTVAEAAFCNPFSDRRDALYRRILGKKLPASDAEAVRQIRAALSARLERWESRGKVSLDQYRGAGQREIVRAVFLFEAYHRFHEQLDRLVADQVDAGETPCNVDFANDALGLLAKRGFSRDEALRFFAIFFQIRRAHHFIHRGLIGESACMREFRRRLWTNVFTHDISVYERFLCSRMEEFSTLLLGETGAGKGLAAAAIGRSGFIPFDARKGRFAESFTRAFVSLNLSQFHETLIESELFGHRKGAFTGAVESHEGVLARCSPHGAAFLDEIGDVAVPVQIKLLQVLQDRNFTPVGSRESRRFQGRVIAATNKPIDDLRQKGAFRDDFFYRLCSDSISVPPLRARLAEDPKELSRLIVHLVARMTGQDSPDLAAMVETAIRKGPGKAYRWPGNVRELEQAVRRILLTRSYEGERPRSPNLATRLRDSLEAGELSANQLLAGYCTLLHRQLGSYEAVARQTGLDRRTVKKHVANWA